MIIKTSITLVLLSHIIRMAVDISKEVMRGVHLIERISEEGSCRMTKERSSAANDSDVFFILLFLMLAVGAHLWEVF
ncbi:hypothetical protein A130_07095 [Vibrio genomosp. F6 str. FF-238]|uniref:Uncharacterized protein n=1 Tax=Vibrio genomosp. F6 str. FF-238 TaxID=1191298 RepID=A0A1E5CSK3_9VIBR|nr:hypothetical protein A130_07095 [Vibrio genomosp. F6 str. FF-238]